METMRFVLAGGDNEQSAKLLAAELRHVPRGEQDAILQAADINCTRAPPEVGVQLRSLMHSWNQLREVKR